MEVDNITAFTRGHDVDDIYIDKEWRPRRGEPMPQMDGYFIGKKFGAGALAMNSIYDLVDKNGNSLGQALKVCKQSLSARRSLAHEWKMFKDLGILGDSNAAVRSHFLQAYRVMKTSNNQIVGIIMEKANGQNVSKTLADPNFCNVRYVIRLLRDLLVALDVAQRVLGFVHYDLKLDNVMEHWSCNDDPDSSKKRVLIDSIPQFKLFDFGTAVIYPDPFAVKRVPNKRLSEEHRPTAAAELQHEKKHGDSDKPGLVTHSAGGDDLEYSEPYCCVRIYHMWWKNRGDIFRVLLALSKKLDDRVWPLEDLELVSLLFTVLEHTTNSHRIKARFMPRAALLKKLGLSEAPKYRPDKPQSCQGAQCSKPNQQQQAPLDPAKYQQPTAPATPPAPAAVDGVGANGVAAGHSPVRRSAADAPRSPRVSSDMFRDGAGAQTGFAGGSANGGVVNMISSMVNSSAGANSNSGTTGTVGTAGFGGLNPVDAVPGVAYTRLAPVSSSTAAVAPDSTSSQLPVSSLAQPQHGMEGLSSIRTGTTAAAGDSRKPGAAAAPAGSPLEPHFDINAADEGCRLDPAAEVVDNMPIASAGHQSVLGSRKALKGVTAQQLLVEPIVQSLLSKV